MRKQIGLLSISYVPYDSNKFLKFIKFVAKFWKMLLSLLSFGNGKNAPNALIIMCIKFWIKILLFFSKKIVLNFEFDFQFCICFYKKRLKIIKNRAFSFKFLKFHNKNVKFI